MFIKWVSQYRYLFIDILYILRYFLLVIFEVTYIGLIHYGFVTLSINYSHLILEHVTVNWTGDCRSGGQRPLPHNPIVNGHPPPLPVPMLHKAIPPAKSSKGDLPPSLPEYLKCGHCFRIPIPLGQMWHDHNHIILYNLTGRIKTHQVWHHTLLPRGCCIQLQTQRICRHCHRKGPPSRNVCGPHIHISEERISRWGDRPKYLWGTTPVPKVFRPLERPPYVWKLRTSSHPLAHVIKTTGR